MRGQRLEKLELAAVTGSYWDGGAGTAFFSLCKEKCVLEQVKVREPVLLVLILLEKGVTKGVLGVVTGPSDMRPQGRGWATSDRDDSQRPYQGHRGHCHPSGGAILYIIEVLCKMCLHSTVVSVTKC